MYFIFHNWCHLPKITFTFYPGLNQIWESHTPAALLAFLRLNAMLNFHLCTSSTPFISVYGTIQDRMDGSTSDGR